MLTDGRTDRRTEWGYSNSPQPIIWLGAIYLITGSKILIYPILILKCNQHARILEVLRVGTEPVRKCHGQCAGNKI